MSVFLGLVVLANRISFFGGIGCDSLDESLCESVGELFGGVVVLANKVSNFGADSGLRFFLM